MPEPITLSENAARRLQAISAREGHAVMLRVAVEGGGCSGFQYRLDLTQTAEPEDLKVERDGAVVLVDDVSVPFLGGAVIDFEDALAGAEFKIRNPNARSSCGCGVSFSI